MKQIIETSLAIATLFVSLTFPQLKETFEMITESFKRSK